MPGRTISPPSRGTIDRYSTHSSTRAVKEEPLGSLCESTRGPENTEPRGPRTEATCSVKSWIALESIAEAESQSNLASLSGWAPVESTAQPGAVLATDQVATLGLRCNAEGLIFEPLQKQMRKVAKGIFKNKVTFLQINSSCDLNSLDTEMEEPLLAEFYKTYKWLSSPKPLAETANILDTAVVLEGFPASKLTKRQAIQLGRAIRSYEKPQFVCFDGIRFERGALILTCADEESKLWLKRTVPKLSLWPCAKLEVGPADLVVHGVKFIFFLNFYMKKFNTFQILDLIQTQNEGLLTREWNVVERNKLDFTVWVDNRTVNALRRRFLKFYVALRRVTYIQLRDLDRCPTLQLSRGIRMDSTGVQSPSNHIVLTGPTQEELCALPRTDLPSEFSVTLGLQSDGTDFVSSSQIQRTTELLVVPYRERRIAWYQIDSGSSEQVKSEIQWPDFAELCKLLRSLNSLTETGNVMDMAVVLEGYPYTAMSKMQADNVCKLINPPKVNLFVAARYEKGALILTCANEAAKVVLRNTVPKLTGKLEVGPADIILHGVKFIFGSPLLKERGATQVLDLIQKQNRGISTKEWNVVERSATSLSVWVDNRTFNTLRERNLKIRVGQSQVEFRPLVNLSNIILADKLTGVQSRSNLAVQNCPACEVGCTDRWARTFGLQSNKMSIRYKSPRDRLIKRTVKRAGLTVVPFGRRWIAWYQIDGSSTVVEDEILRTHLADIYDVYNWFVTGESLEETGNNMGVAVVLEGFPYRKMTKVQAEVLCNTIRWDNTGERLPIVAARYERGATIFTCATEKTKMYLKETILKLTFWPYGRLEVASADIVVHGIKLVFCLTSDMGYVGNEQILDMIEKQNEGLSTDEWSVVERSKFVLAVWVDNRSLNFLRARYLKLNLGQSQVELRPLLNFRKPNSEDLCPESVPLQHTGATGTELAVTKTGQNRQQKPPGLSVTHVTRMLQNRYDSVVKADNPEFNPSIKCQISDGAHSSGAEVIVTKIVTPHPESNWEACGSTDLEEVRCAPVNRPVAGDTGCARGSKSQLVEMENGPSGSSEIQKRRFVEVELQTVAETNLKKLRPSQ